MIVRKLPLYLTAPLIFVESVVRGTLLVFGASLGMALVVTLLALLGGAPMLEVLAVSGIVFVAMAALSPYFWSQYVFQPLGMWRCAWVAGRLSSLRWGAQRPHGALIEAGRAALRSRDADGAALFLTASLQRAARLDGASASAGAILALLHGNSDRARQLFEQVLALDPKAVPRPADHLAREWLALDAAERGDWSAAEKWSVGRWRSRSLLFIHGVARRMQGHAVLALRLRWLLAPGRRDNRSIYLRANQDLGGGDQVPHEAPASSTGSGATEALRLYVSGLGATRPRTQVLLGVATAAGALEDDIDFRDRARSRARALGVDEHGDQALGVLKSEVVADLVALAREGSVTVAELEAAGGLGPRVAAALRDELMDEVEAVFEALGQRVAEDRSLPPIDELTEWSVCVALYERTAARGGLELRQLLWPVVHKRGCEYGCWLHEHARHRITGNAVFRFLLEEARRLDDPSAIDLQQNNVKVGW